MRNLIDRALLKKIFTAWLALGLLLITASALAQVQTSDLVFDCAMLDQFAREGTLIFPAERAWYKRNCVEEKEEFPPPPPTPTPTPRPPVDTCSHLPADISVSGFSPFSTQCRQVGSAGVGNAGLIAQGVLRAVDIWANANTEIRVCFRGQGRLKFLDAATSPRAVLDLAAVQIDGMTCGRINRAGTVALVQGGQTVAQTIAEPIESPPSPAQTVPASTTSCELAASVNLSLRAGPSVYYSRLLAMPRGARLVATARIDDWFMVNYQGQVGWALGEYLVLSPDCAGLGEAGAIILPPMRQTQTAQTDARETMSDAAATEMAESGGLALSGCRLTAGDIINLRAGPGLDFEIYAEIPNEARLIATAIAQDWFMVEYAGQVGWVSREYVFRSGNCAASVPTAVPKMTAIAVPGASPLTGCSLRTVDNVNLRQGPGLDYEVHAEIPYLTNLNATGRSGEWFMVDYAGTAGWVSIAYVFRTGACD